MSVVHDLCVVTCANILSQAEAETWLNRGRLGRPGYNGEGNDSTELRSCVKVKVAVLGSRPAQ